MPKTPIDYSNISFYRIVSKDPNITDCYIGSTSNLTKRKCKHKHSCNNENSKGYDYNVYKFIRENGGWDNWDLIEIEKKSCDDINDKLRRERCWLEFYQASLNKVIPTRTDKEYYNDNKEKLTEYQKQYNKENNEYINERNKLYREQNKEKYAECKKRHTENNKDKIAEYQKQYREQNKEKIQEKNKQMYNCDCGAVLTKKSETKHILTKKHQNYLNEIALTTQPITTVSVSPVQRID